MKRLLSSLLCAACALGLMGGIVAAQPEEPDGPILTSDLPESVRVGESTGEYAATVDRLFPGEWVSVAVETAGPVWMNGPTEETLTEGYADESGTFNVPFFSDGLSGIYYAPGTFTATVTLRRTLLPDGGGPVRYFDSEQDREITAEGAEGVPEERRFSCEIEIGRPVVSHNLPESIPVGSTLDFAAELRGVAYENGKVDSQPTGKPFYIPSVEIDGDAAESDEIDESETLRASRTLTFNRVGTVRLRVRFTPAVRLDPSDAQEWIDRAGEAVIGQTDEGETLLITLAGAVEEEIAVEVTDGDSTDSGSADPSVPETAPTKPETSSENPETTPSAPDTSRPAPTQSSQSSQTPKPTQPTRPSTTRPESSDPIPTNPPASSENPPATSEPGLTWPTPTTSEPEREPPITTPALPDPPTVVLTDRYFGLQIVAPSGVLPDGAVLDVVRSAARLEDAKGRNVVFDVAVKKGDASVRPAGEVTVRIPIPSSYDRSGLTVYEIDGDGRARLLESEIDGDCVRFVTDHLDVAFALSEQPLPSDEPSGPILLWIAGIGGGILLLSGAILAFWFLIFKRKPHRVF